MLPSSSNSSTQLISVLLFVSVVDFFSFFFFFLGHTLLALFLIKKKGKGPAQICSIEKKEKNIYQLLAYVFR